MEAHHLSHLIHLIIAGQEQTLGCADSEILQKGGEIYPKYIIPFKRPIRYLPDRFFIARLPQFLPLPGTDILDGIFRNKILLDSGVQLLYNLHKYAVISCGYEGLEYEYN